PDIRPVGGDANLGCTTDSGFYIRTALCDCRQLLCGWRERPWFCVARKGVQRTGRHLGRYQNRPRRSAISFRPALRRPAAPDGLAAVRINPVRASRAFAAYQDFLAL